MNICGSQEFSAEKSEFNRQVSDQLGRLDYRKLKHNRRFVRFLTAGTLKVSSELYFLGLSQNILKWISKCNAKEKKPHLLSPKKLLKF